MRASLNLILESFRKNTDVFEAGEQSTVTVLAVRRSPQGFHFEGNSPNSRKSYSFPSNFSDIKYFQEIQDYGNICKHVEKYDFYGLIKATKKNCSHKPISICLVEGPGPELGKGRGQSGQLPRDPHKKGTPTNFDYTF